jgi:hypothetical protein
MSSPGVKRFEVFFVQLQLFNVQQVRLPPSLAKRHLGGMSVFVVAHIRAAFLESGVPDRVLTYPLDPTTDFSALWFDMLEDAAALGLKLRLLEQQQLTPTVRVILIEEVTVDHRAADTTAQGNGLRPISLSPQDLSVRESFFRSFHFEPGLAPAVEGAYRQSEEAEVRRYRERGFFQYGTPIDHVAQGGIPDPVWHHPTVRSYISGRRHLYGYLGSPARRIEVDERLCALWLAAADVDSLARWLISPQAWEFMEFAKPQLGEEIRRLESLVPEEVRKQASRSS